MLKPSVLKELKKIVGPANLYTSAEEMVVYSYDATQRESLPWAVARPGSAQEVAALMKVANREIFPVVPRGAGSGMSGGSVPVKGGLVLSLERMNRILEIDEKNMQVVVEPGVVSADLQETLKKYNLFFPPDPSSTIESTLGGNVAENAGYTRAVKYGVTRDYIIGLEAVLPNGDVINVGGRTVKNVTGYDLVALLIGSEGTLAVVTKIIAKLLPKPVLRRTCIFYLDDLVAAADLVVSVFGCGIVPCAIEFMDNTSIKCVADYLSADLRKDAAAMVLIEVDGSNQSAVDEEVRLVMETAGKAKGVIESKLAASDEEADRLWRIRRETLPALKALGKDHLEADVVVPRYQLPLLARSIQESGAGKKVNIATYGHSGDGNLHVTIQYRKRNFAETEEAYELLGEIYRRTIGMGGKLTGEHGVGLTAKNYMSIQMGATEIELMKRIKKAFDPKGLLNPQKIFPDEGMTET